MAGRTHSSFGHLAATRGGLFLPGHGRPRREAIGRCFRVSDASRIACCPVAYLLPSAAASLRSVFASLARWVRCALVAVRGGHRLPGLHPVASSCPRCKSPTISAMARRRPETRSAGTRRRNLCSAIRAGSMNDCRLCTKSRKGRFKRCRRSLPLRGVR